jgi:hypothetical protein
MTDLLAIAGEVLAELLRSDVDGHLPHPVYSWLAVLVAHIGLGMMVALSPARKLATALLVIYIAKEIAFDMRLSGFAFAISLDSIADTLALCIGYGWAMSVARRIKRA